MRSNAAPLLCAPFLQCPTCIRCPQPDAMLLASSSLWSGTPHAGYMPPLGYAALSYLNIPVPFEQRLFESKPAVPSEQQNVPAPKPKVRKPRQTKKWYEILGELERDPKQLSTQQSATGSSAFQQFVKTSIAAATKAAEKDKQWAESGVVELLQQASKSLAEGDIAAARQQAVSLVDFQRIAASVRKTSNGDEGSSRPDICETCSSSLPCDCQLNNQQVVAMTGIALDSTSPSTSSSVEVASKASSNNNNNVAINPSNSPRTAMLPPKRPATGYPDMQQASKRNKAATSKASQLSLGSGRDVPKEMPPNCKEVLKTIHSTLHDGSADCLEAPEQVLERDNFTKLDFKHWSGKVKHKQGASVTEFCSLTINIPQLYMEQMPVTLYATDILHRRQISLGKHLTCRCTLGGLSSKQHDSMAAMARTQLVAIVELQYCALHLVPYFDNSNNLKVVGFLKLYT